MEEYRLFQRLFNVLNSTFPKPELLVYLHRPVEVLLNNIEARGRAYEKDISADYLQELQNAYFDYFKMENDIPILIVDMGNLHFSRNSQPYQQFLEMLNQPYSAGIHRVSFAQERQSMS